MKVLVVGSGGREHAIVDALFRSPSVDKIYCAPGNAGIAQQAECVAIKDTDVEGVKAFAKENKIPYVDYYSALVDDQGGLPVKYSKDGVHPNSDGYTVMEGVILPILKKYVG